MSPVFSHISYERLVDWADARLPADRQSAVAAHLESCARCRAEATQLQQLISLMRTDTSQDAPQAVIARAVQLFPSRAVEAGPSLAQRLVAVLRFETTPLTPALGLRSQGAAERQVIYSAGDYDVDLRILPAPSGWTLSGQVLGSDEAGEATLTGEGTQLHTPVGKDAFFSFPAVPDGNYTLALALSGVEIVVEAFRFGDA